MPDRINTPLTNEHFASFCISMLGQPYWYGTALHKCSESLRASKARQYPSHYGSSRTSRYRQDIANKKVCADCMGGAKGYAWTLGGQGVLEAIGNDKTSRRNPAPTAARTSPRIACSRGRSRRAWTGAPSIRCRTSSASP